MLSPSQAVEVVMQNVDFGMPGFLVRGKLSTVVDTLYAQGYAIARAQDHQGYRSISGSEAVNAILAAAMMVGIALDITAKVQNGVSRIEASGFKFVKRG